MKFRMIHSSRPIWEGTRISGYEHCYYLQMHSENLVDSWKTIPMVQYDALTPDEQDEMRRTING